MRLRPARSMTKKTAKISGIRRRHAGGAPARGSLAGWRAVDRDLRLSARRQRAVLRLFPKRFLVGGVVHDLRAHGLCKSFTSEGRLTNDSDDRTQRFLSSLF